MLTTSSEGKNTPQDRITRRCLFQKRIFDLIVCLLAAWLWIPVLAVCSLLILLFSGTPIFYISSRRIQREKTRDIAKFRAMVRNAEQIANCDTIPVIHQRFLNIPPGAPLYTPIGKLLEKFCVTELPQLFEVLLGNMSLVGNRPLPEAVIRSLKEAYPHTEDRFLTKCGMTGPVQLVGRILISDDVRLKLEIDYCRICLQGWSVRLDMMILIRTVLIGMRIHRLFSPNEVEVMMRKYARKTIRRRSRSYLSPRKL
jgi:lipopolysaccharide/colanic/teichoic acid biosynthesis glycosyltransferase